jgi:DNA modification methylase
MTTKHGRTKASPVSNLIQSLIAFEEFGTPTQVESLETMTHSVPILINEFWTSKQRAANPLHEISYRACFKPQLPRFFIERFTELGETVYDPFMGRGTTLLEASLLGRKVVGCDINPVGRVLIEPRLSSVDIEQVSARLEEIDLTQADCTAEEELLAFYHPETLVQVVALKNYFVERAKLGSLDLIDQWIRMVATNRLTGHSPGFFSVYTMPPNQAVTAKRQLIINAKRDQVPPVRDIKAIIHKKSRSLLKDSDTKNFAAEIGDPLLLIGDCSETPQIAPDSVSLVVTSPPFLDVVDYRTDNWLRCWFNGVDSQSLPIWQIRKPAAWVEKMSKVFSELARVLVPNGVIAFEVGDIRGGKVLMENLVLDAIAGSGLVPEFVLINAQDFTKTANCWGVSNATKGTNTNRIVVLRKEIPLASSQSKQLTL